MLSRRTLRIKVLQTIYGFELQDDLPIEKSRSLLNLLITNYYKAYLLSLQFIVKVCLYNNTYRDRMAEKHIKSTVSDDYPLILANNPIIQSIENNKSYQLQIEDFKQQYQIKNEDLKLLYKDLTKKDRYKSYFNDKNMDFQKHQKILIYIFNKLLLKSDLYKMHFEDQFINWYDIRELVYKSINDKIRACTAREHSFPVFYQPLGEQRKFFAESLLIKTINSKKDNLKLIEPYLKNWDIDRVTSIDIIILRLAISEFNYFEEIPVKVTLNEYIELSKLYSTPKSKEFINGILDKLMRNLKATGKIKKSGRGLLDL